MTIVRDTSFYSPRWRCTCAHLAADRVWMLHNAAAHLGLKREWFQAEPYPHYDLIGTQAIKRAAQARVPIVRRKEMVRIARESAAFVSTSEETFTREKTAGKQEATP